MTESDVALLLVLACAALVCDALRPAQRKRGWDNSRKVATAASPALIPPV